MKPKQLALDAMLIAMFVALSFVSVDLGNLKITFDALPILIGALLFGPVDGLIIGLLGGFMYQLLSYGVTATTVLWLLPSAARGLLVGWYAKKKGYNLSRTQTAVIVVLSSLLVSTMNTGALYVDSKIYGYYAFGFVFGVAGIRYLLSILTAILYTVVLPPLLKIVGRLADKRPVATEGKPV